MAQSIQSKKTKIDLWSFVKSITQNKNQIELNEETEKEYTPALVNKAVSHHLDSVFFANMMNIYSKLPKKLQYDFLINIVKRKTQYVQWIKGEKNPQLEENINALRSYYGYNEKKAVEALFILSEGQLKKIKDKLQTGGVIK